MNILFKAMPITRTDGIANVTNRFNWYFGAFCCNCCSHLIWLLLQVFRYKVKWVNSNYWAPQNPYVALEHNVNKLGVTVQGWILTLGVRGPFFLMIKLFVNVSNYVWDIQYIYIYIYIYTYREIGDFGESDKMMKISGKVDKSDTCNGFSDVSFFIQRTFSD